MRNIKDLTSDGFTLSERGDDLKDVAMVSLKIALQAFFSTYKAVKRDFVMYKMGQQLGNPDCPFPASYSSAYCEASTEAIVHFQHFVELVFKDLLHADHTVGFRIVAEHLYALIKSKQLRNYSELDFILEFQQALDELNHLRNRIWHRGVFILRYHALDEFVGYHILPFIEKVMGLPQYADKQYLWKYSDLSCGVDPIKEITDHFRSGQYDICKVALLKELGRAAYVAGIVMPKLGRGIVDRGERRRLAEGMAAARAKAESEGGDVIAESVRNCPVCGVKTLIMYGDFDSYPVIADYDEDTPEPVWFTTFDVECTNCTFSIHDEIDNPSTYGLPLEDYWHSEEIPVQGQKIRRRVCDGDVHP